jgi:hypothetical protein
MFPIRCRADESGTFQKKLRPMAPTCQVGGVPYLHNAGIAMKVNRHPSALTCAYSATGVRHRTVGEIRLNGYWSRLAFRRQQP